MIKTVNILVLFLAIALSIMMALVSCSTISRQENGIPSILYKATIMKSDEGMIVAVDAKSNSGKIVVSHVDSGIILHYRDKSASLTRATALETLQNSDKHYEIFDNRWTRVINLPLNKEIASAGVDSVAFRLRVGVASKLVVIKIKNSST